MFIDYLPECFFYGKDSEINVLILDTLRNIPNTLLAFFAQIVANLESDRFLNILGMIGIALLTVSIPIAVAFFKGNKGGYETLDINVILDHVLGARFFLRYLSFIYAPIFLLALVPLYPIFKIAALILWGVGVHGIVNILIRVYYWMKDERDKIRKEYLRALNTSNKLEDAPKLWRSVWEVEGRRDYQEKEFFIIFSSTIDKLLKGGTNSIKTASELVNIFNEHIYKRPIIFLVSFDEVFPKILEWHFLAWKKVDEYRHRGFEGLSLFNSELNLGLSSTLKQVQERAFEEKEFFLFFYKFMPHVERHKTDSIKMPPRKKYAEDLVISFFHIFLENIKSTDVSEKAWEDFPSEWKITEENIKMSKNKVVIVLFNGFMFWASPRILTSKNKEHDRVLDDVIHHLFPNVCPMKWARILAPLMRAWEGDSRMKHLVDYPINFGVERIRFGWVEDGPEGDKKQREKEKREEEEEEKETINLALHIGGLTEGFLNERIAELEKMEGDYSADSSAEWSRKGYIDLFKRINARREELRNSANQ